MHEREKETESKKSRLDDRIISLVRSFVLSLNVTQSINQFVIQGKRLHQPLRFTYLSSCRSLSLSPPSLIVFSEDSSHLVRPRLKLECLSHCGTFKQRLTIAQLRHIFLSYARDIHLFLLSSTSNPMRNQLPTMM